MEEIVEQVGATSRDGAFVLVAGIDPISDAATAVGLIEGMRSDRAGEYAIQPDPGIGALSGLVLPADPLDELPDIVHRMA